MKKILCVIALLSAVNGACQVAEVPEGKWLNLDFCSNDDFVVFDFSEKMILDASGKKHSMSFDGSKMSFGINDKTIEFPIRQMEMTDTTMNVCSEDYCLRLVRVTLPAILNEKELVGKIYKTGGVKADESEYYLEFFSDGAALVTSTDSNDTISNFNNWKILTTKIGSVLEMNLGVNCRSYILRQKGSKEITFIQGEKYLRFLEVPRQTKFNIESLLGEWTVIDSSEPTAATVKTVSFKKQQMTIQGLVGYSDEPPSPYLSTSWSVDYFHRTIMTGLRIPFTDVPFELYSDGTLMLYIKNVKYTLAKIDH
jgi:hypothetical protein